jgi:large subunit ribosomal protein L10
MPTQAKTDLVADLKEQFSQSSAIFITNYSGLNVEQITKLRKSLRENGVRFIVAKNTLIRIAAREAGFDDLDAHLAGPVAVAFAKTEANIPAKILFDACKEFDNVKKPEVKAFYVDRMRFAGADVERIAKLPSREILLSQLVAAVEGPIANFVGTLDSIIRELVGTVDAIARQKGE